MQTEYFLFNAVYQISAGRKPELKRRFCDDDGKILCEPFRSGARMTFNESVY